MRLTVLFLPLPVYNVKREENMRASVNLDELRRSVRGHVIGPEDDGYE